MKKNKYAHHKFDHMNFFNYLSKIRIFKIKIPLSDREFEMLLNTALYLLYVLVHLLNNIHQLFF